MENFKKEILKSCKSPEEMFAEEAKIVNEDFLKRTDVYNLNVGGPGSWWRANSVESWRYANTIRRAKLQEKLKDEEFKDRWKKSISSAIKSARALNGSHWSGKTHSEETKAVMRSSHQGKHTGEKNSQFGSRWINDGVVSKKIQKLEALPDGWKFGRA